MFAFFCIELIKVAKLEIANLEGDEIHWMLTFCPPTSTFWASAFPIERHQIKDYKSGSLPLRLKGIRSNYVKVTEAWSINTVKVTFDTRYGHLE